MQAFAGFSSNLKLGKKVKLFVALAPVVTVIYMQGVLKYLNYGSYIGKVNITVQITIRDRFQNVVHQNNFIFYRS